MNYTEFKAFLETNPQLRTMFLSFLEYYVSDSIGFDFCAPKMINGEFDYSEIVGMMQRCIVTENEQFEDIMTKYQNKVQTDKKCIQSFIDFALPLPISEEVPPPWMMNERRHQE